MLPDKRSEWAYNKWQDVFRTGGFAPDAEPGHLAWRTVVLHRRRKDAGWTLLDAGFGGGEDLVFSAERGYTVTGLEFSENAVAIATKLLAARGQRAQLFVLDLRALDSSEDLTAGQQFDVVLFSNVTQDLGDEAPACLDRLKARVRPGGVIGVSVMAPSPNLPDLEDCFPEPDWSWIERISVEQRQARFDMIISARGGGA